MYALLNFQFPGRQSLFLTLIDLAVDLTQKAHSVLVCVSECTCVGDPPNHKPSQLSELWLFFFSVFLGGRTFSALHVATPFITHPLYLSLFLSYGTKNML